MSEFAPPGSNARMTPSQMRKYIRDMKKAQEEAQKKLEAAENSGEFKKEKQELNDLEDMIDEL